MRLLLVALLILHNLPLKNATSIYEFSQPKVHLELTRNVTFRWQVDLPDPNRTDIRFLFYSSIRGFKNPNFIQNVSDFLDENEFSTSYLMSSVTEDILENTEHFSNFSEKPTLWIIDFQSLDYTKIFPQFELRHLSCDEFEFLEKFREYRNFQKFDLLLLETYSECGLKIHKEISEKSDFLSQIFAWRWKFHDIVLFESDKTAKFTYSPYPEYREELSNLENIKKQRFFQNIYIDALHEIASIDFHFYGEILVISFVSIRWVLLGNSGYNSIYYAFRRIFHIFMTKSKPMSKDHLYLLSAHLFHMGAFMSGQRNWIYFFRQLMNLEMVYKLARYFVEDSREVIWPLILANEIFDVYRVLILRTTEYLPFEMQLLRISQTLEHFVLLNQYPDFNLLDWLCVIFSCAKNEHRKDRDAHFPLVSI